MNENVSPFQPLLTPTEAARRLGLSPKTLANWRCRGGGPRFVRLGGVVKGTVRYPADELDRWCSSRLIGSTSEQTNFGF